MREVRRFLVLLASEQPAAICIGRRLLVMLLLSWLAMSQVMAQQGWEAPPLLDGAMKITAEELLDLKAEFTDLVIIDARSSEEANALNIEGAVSVSDRTLSPNTLASMTKDKFTPLVIFGADEHSVHGFKAARQAVALGYSYVFWFRGGMQEWLDKGMPVVRVEK